MTDSPATGPGERDPASFRDPAGYVFHMRGRVFRALDEATAQIVGRLISEGHLDALVRDGLVVGTRSVTDPDLVRELSERNPGYNAFLEHDPLPHISYPHEWTVSMLADAGILTLDLQARLLDHGVSLKDATAYNVQFVGSKPIFIDVSSFERPARMDLWYAMGQFHRMFTFPLLLCCRYGWDLRSCFLPGLDGRDIEQVARVIRGVDRLRPGLLLDFTMPLLLTRKANRSPSKDPQMTAKGGTNTGPQLMNIARLRKKIAALAASYKPQSGWTDYTTTCTYVGEGEQGKKAVIQRFLDRVKPRRVLDLGCNTGEYSFLAAKSGATVLAADGDHDAVEALYRRLRREPARITPVVLDAANPSPAIGYMNRERTSFLERLNVDCVFALALVHHLLVSANLSLAAICTMFAEITREHLIVEYVPKDDPQFKRILAFRVDVIGELSLASFREAFSGAFEVLAEEPVPGSERTLLLMRKRAAQPA